MLDLYTKAVLTMIAISLVALAIEQAPFSPAIAQQGPTQVQIVDESGRTAAFASHLRYDAQANPHPVLLTELAAPY